MAFPFAEETGLADGYFVAREEGGDYEWLPFDQWRHATPYVPIFGVLYNGEARVYDRIVELNAPGVSPWRTLYFEKKADGFSRVSWPPNAVSTAAAIETGTEIVWSTFRDKLQDLANNTHRIGPFDLADAEWPEKLRGAVESFRLAYGDFVIIESSNMVRVDRDKTGAEISVGVIVGGLVGT